jgi:iron complex outermembrane receptor protein
MKDNLPVRFKRNKFKAAISMALVSSSIATSLVAQELSESLEEIVIVGSQIRGARVTGALPVSLINRDQIAATAAVSGDDLFRSLPEAGDITFNGTYLGGTNSNAARGDVSTVSLRGLAQGNTLLLLNGRRSVVHPTSQTDNGTPVFGYNVNAIPVQGIERVEILKDGAAALYGSDAIAGVVNNVLQSDFVGLKATMQYGVSEADEWTANLVYGTDFAGGRGNVSVFIGATHKDAIVAADQPYTSTSDLRSQVVGTAFEGNALFDQRSTSSSWGGFQALGVIQPITSNGAPITDTAGFFHVQPADRSGCTYNVDSDICYSSGTVTTGANRYLRADTVLFEGFTQLPETDRYNAFSFVNYELSDSVSFFGELGLYSAKTSAKNSAGNSLGSTPIFIPASGYYNPFGPIGSPNRLPGLNIPDEGLPLQIRNYRYTDMGSRNIDVENSQYRILGGLRGDAFGWAWESALLYNESNVKDSQDHGSSSAIQAALGRTTPDAYNPFTGGDPANPSLPVVGMPNPQSTIDSFMITAVRENNAALSLWDFKVSRPDLFSIPGGGVGIAGGIEYREHDYDDNRDSRQDESSPYVDVVSGSVYGSDLLGHSPSPDVQGNRSVVSAYIELAIPLVSPDMGVPLIESLDLQLAGRYEDYSDVGSVTNPKAAMAWDVIEGLRLRGSWSEGFKAPNLEVVNIPALERLNGRLDNYACDADLRAGRISSFSACTRNYGVPGLRQGNPQLQPEESESFSYGVVLLPDLLPQGAGDFTITVDSWTIKQTGIVGVLDEQFAMNLDYLARLQGSSNANVVRDAPTPQDILDFQGTGLAPVGEVLFVNSLFDNLLPQEVSGIDFGITWANEIADFGNFSINLNATKLVDFFQEPGPQQQVLIDASNSGELNPAIPITGVSNLIEQDGNPQWRGSLSGTWSRGAWQAGFMALYTGAVEQPAVTDANNNPWIVDSHQTFNLYGQFTTDSWFGDDTGLRFGARNLTDEEPPFARGGYLGNLHQPQGRYVYASINQSF